MNEQHIERAQVLLGQDRYDLAEKELRAAVAQDPYDPMARALLAAAVGAQNRHSEALAEAKEAIKLAPDWAFGHYILADVYDDLERYRESEAAAREAIRLDPANADSYVMLGQSLMRQSRWQEAHDTAERALELDSENTTAANLRAMALVKLRRRDEAGAALDSALGRDPENPLTHANRGWALLEAGQHRPAMESFRTALSLDPQMEWAREGILEALKARNPVYRLMLRYFFFMSRLSAQAQWGVIIGGMFVSRALRSAIKANPELAPYLGPLLILYWLFVFLTWTAKPLFNLLLRLDSFGRLALTRDQIIASNWVGGALLFAFVGGVAGVLLASVPLMLLAIVSALLMIPLSGTFAAQNRTSRIILAVWTGILAAAAVAAAGIIGATGSVGAAGIPFAVLGFGFLLYVWVANALIMRR